VSRFQAVCKLALEVVGLEGDRALLWRLARQEGFDINEAWHVADDAIALRLTIDAIIRAKELRP